MVWMKKLFCGVKVYVAHLSKLQIGQGRNGAPNRDNTCTPTSKRQAIQDEVDDIVAQLQEKHGSQYLPVQYRLWANMLQIGTHRDYSVPPNVPMFGAGKSSKATAGTSISEALPV